MATLVDQVLRGCRRFRRATAGSTAIEFAFIAPLLLVTILFLMSVGYILFMMESLDYATQKAARQVRTGYVQGATTNVALTQTQFRTQVICPLLPSMFNCSNVIVNLQAVPYSYYNPNQYYNYVNSKQSGLILPTLDNTQTSYCPGNPKGYVYLQVLYPVNLFLSMMSSATYATTYQGQQVYLIMATATFLNEPFVAPTSSC